MPNKLRILIAEDHTITHAGLELILKEVDDFEIVAVAQDGRRAVELSQQLAPDVVLMDIGLPVLEGIAATQRIKDQPNPPRVLILTCRTSDEELVAAFQAGADGYCLKDVSKQQLVSAVRSVHAGATWLDPTIAGRLLSMKAAQENEAEQKKHRPFDE